MLKGKKRLLIAGCALIAIAVMLVLYAVLIGFGIINIHPNTLVIRAGTAEKAYDGEALVCEEWSLVHGELKRGHTLIPLFSGSQTMPGQSANHVTVRIMDSNDVDVTSEYRIEYLDGTLSVYNPKLTITSSDYAKEYDGTPLVSPSDGWQLESGSLMSGHTLSVTMTGVQDTVGSCENTFHAVVTDEGGQDVTEHYAIEAACGTLEILPRSVTVKSASAKWKYDGTTLTAPSAQVVQGNLLRGHQLQCEFTGNQTELGISENLFTVDIVDEDGNSVLSYYDVTSMTGILAVVEFIPHDDEDAEGSELSPELNSSVNGDTPQSDVDVLALQTNAAGPVYLRLQHFGDYNTENFGWDLAPALTESVCGTNPLQWVSSALLQSGEALSSMSITWLESSRGLLAPYYTQTNFSTGVDDSYIPLGDWDYTVDYVSYDALQTLRGRTSSLTLPPELAAEEAAYRTYVYEHYLEIPNEELRGVIWRHIKGHISPSSKTLIQDVASYIQGAAAYNMEAELPPDGVDPIIFFLETSKEGVCRHYASAAVMMYRALGIPARYTVGYMTYAPANQMVYVSAMRAHAWVEVYIDGLGWLPVEVTGGDSGGDGGFTESVEKIPLTVRPLAVYGLANGTEYRAVNYRLVGELQDNHGFSCTFGGSLSVPGTAVSYIESYSIFDRNSGEDVSHLYEVETLEGLIHVVDKSQNLDELKQEEPVWLVIKPVNVEALYRGSPISASEWEYLPNSPQLKDGHRLECLYDGELSEPGTAVSSIRSCTVLDEQDNDVTEQYEITCQEGILKLLPPDLYLIIKPKDVFGLPTGETWTAKEWEYSAKSEDKLLEGHTLVCTFDGSRVDYGESVSTIVDYVILDEEQGDVSYLYNVVTMPGRIVVQRTVSIKPKDVQAMYDGTPHGASEWEYVKGSYELPENQEFVDVTYGGAAVYPIWPDGNFSSEAEYFNAIKQKTTVTGFRIVDTETGKDVTDLYNVDAQNGYVAIRGLEIEVIPENLIVPHNGRYQQATEYSVNAISYVAGSKEWLNRYTVEVTLDGQRQDYGISTISVASVRVLDGAQNDVTRAFDVTTKTATLQVYAEKLVFETGSARKEYDGLELRLDEYTLLSGGVLDGHTLDVQLNAAITAAGQVRNTPTITITDGNGENVTDHYYLDMSSSVIGTLTVDKVKLTITSDSATRPYIPDEELVCHTYTMEGSVVEGETIEVLITGSQILPGISENFIAWEDVHIYRDGVETTSNYEIHVIAGQLEVTSP